MVAAGMNLVPALLDRQKVIPLGVFSSISIQNRPFPSFHRSVQAMCFPVVCSSCKKTTWDGCGMHVDDVMSNVPADRACECR